MNQIIDVDLFASLTNTKVPMSISYHMFTNTLYYLDLILDFL